MLDKFVGQVIRLLISNDSMSLTVFGTLAAVVGENNYILRVRDTDVTLRFRVASVYSIATYYSLASVHIESTRLEE